jgi:glyoxylase-like metal-dependent hydrolase (beta-lactamase superfamily II)
VSVFSGTRPFRFHHLSADSQLDNDCFPLARHPQGQGFSAVSQSDGGSLSAGKQLQDTCLFSNKQIEIHAVGAAPGGEAYLLLASDFSLLYDSGFGFSAPGLVCNVERLLGGRSPDCLFLSHSHYDHASGSAWCKRRWPNLPVVAMAHAKRVFERPTAVASIRDLNQRVAQERGLTFDDADFLDTLAVSHACSDGELLELGSQRFEVVEAVGHTRCSAMLWCEQQQLLLGSESLGVYLNQDEVMPAYLVSYEGSLRAIERAQALNPKWILLNHRHVAEGKDARRFLVNAGREARRAAQLVFDGSRAGKSREVLTQELKRLYYTKCAQEIQPEAAFDLNNRLMLDLLLKR